MEDTDGSKSTNDFIKEDYANGKIYVLNKDFDSTIILKPAATDNGVLKGFILTGENTKPSVDGAVIHEGNIKLTAGAFDNPDTGNRDKKEFNSTAAHIIEVGPDCKYAHAGDDCFIDLRATRPICFRGNYYFITAEQNIVALLGDELSERFKK